MRKLSLDIRQRRDDGFTLIELLVVVVILGVLIGIAIPVYLNYRRSANDNAAQSDVRNAVSTLEVCNSDGGYPTAVPAGGGALTAGCTQTITISSGTTLRYVPNSTTAPVATYTIYGNNSGGSDRVYCYNSSTGGSVKSATGATGATAAARLAAATCPA